MQKQHNKTTDKYFFQNTLKITQKKFVIRYTHIMQSPYNKK
jgi:hypothetical protein